MRLVAVIQIGGVVGEFVSRVDQLGLKRRPFIQPIFCQLRKFGWIVIARVLDDSFAYFKSQIQAAKCSVTLFEVLDYAQRMQVVVKEKSVTPHSHIQRLFSGMTERGMSNVVHQIQALNQISIESKLGGDGARNLRDLKRVRQAITKMIGIAAGEDLRLSLKPPKRARMDHAITVALKIVTVGMRGLRIATSARVLHLNG